MHKRSKRLIAGTCLVGLGTLGIGVVPAHAVIKRGAPTRPPAVVVVSPKVIKRG